MDANGAPKNANGIDDDNNGYIDDWRGWNFQGNNNDPIDNFGHGTHCAGTIGARGNDGYGITGVNWNVSIVPLRFMDNWGSGSLAAAVAAMEYAVKMKFDISSNSWGGPGDSEEPKLWKDLFARAEAQGRFIVVAAGNETSNNDEEPNNYPATIRGLNVLSVAATNEKDLMLEFSNYGEESVDIAAPGSGILSTVKEDRHTQMSGTSMATPFVAGAIALIKSKYPNASIQELRERILGSVDLQPGLRGIIGSGGRLNVYRALTAETNSIAGETK